ncbi:hypothetical protein GEV33_006406 [Tenebrio molitor]|uniref:Uncharacterized protein n=1 Tax=Tenebrio molitor TaxID=7067 RepID=A0A8J6HCP8_TENMO|nr:hypothetical protein GEV33_006406 [Tenebrio molitor]
MPPHQQMLLSLLIFTTNLFRPPDETKSLHFFTPTGRPKRRQKANPLKHYEESGACEKSPKSGTLYCARWYLFRPHNLHGLVTQTDLTSREILMQLLVVVSSVFQIWHVEIGDDEVWGCFFRNEETENICTNFRRERYSGFMGRARSHVCL